MERSSSKGLFLPLVHVLERVAEWTLCFHRTTDISVLDNLPKNRHGYESAITLSKSLLFQDSARVYMSN